MGDLESLESRITPSGWLDTYASYFPDLGVGEYIIYPIVSTVVGDEGLAGASDTQLLLGTGGVVVAGAVVAEVGTIAATGTSIGGLLTGGGATATATTAAPTIGEIVTGFGDDVLVHFGPARVNPILPNGGASYWFRFGDIANLTTTQVESLIGGLAAGGETGGAAVIHLGPAAGGAQTISGIMGFTEYLYTTPVRVLIGVPL